jgi:hypothetical protein
LLIQIWESSKGVVGREPRRTGENLSVWIVGIIKKKNKCSRGRPGLEGKMYSRWVPGEGRVGTLIRAVFTDLYGPVENPSIESYGGGLLESFRVQMWGFPSLA